MNYDEFVATFRTTEKIADQEGKATVAGTVLAATDESCYIDINGVQYEIASGDVIDIQVLSPIDSPKAERTEDVDSPNEDSGEADVFSRQQSPPAVLITLDRNAVLCHRIPAALIATTGTWMAIVPPAVQPV